MSDPGVTGPLSEFERRCRLLFAHSATCRTLLGAADADEAMTGGKLLNVWDIEETEEDSIPTCPVVFVTPDYDNIRVSPEANVDGLVMVSIHVTAHADHRDSKENARKWFANEVGTLMAEITELEGTSFADGTHLRFVRRDTNSDGFMMICGPSWADQTNAFLPKGEDELPTLVSAFSVHLET